MVSARAFLRKGGSPLGPKGIVKARKPGTRDRIKKFRPNAKGRGKPSETGGSMLSCDLVL